MIMNLKSFFPLIVGLSFWIYGNILLVMKLQTKTIKIKDIAKE